MEKVTYQASSTVNLPHSTINQNSEVFVDVCLPWKYPSVNFQWYIKNECSDVASSTLQGLFKVFRITRTFTFLFVYIFCIFR